MTELRCVDAYFGGAYATESLEHAVEIERAVAEICRVVDRVGGVQSSTRMPITETV